jgi:hypothetical protein
MYCIIFWCHKISHLKSNEKLKLYLLQNILRCFSYLLGRNKCINALEGCLMSIKPEYSSQMNSNT